MAVTFGAATAKCEYCEIATAAIVAIIEVFILMTLRFAGG
jgi:hypothetical protein